MMMVHPKGHMDMRLLPASTSLLNIWITLINSINCRYPLKVTKRMGKKAVAKRIRIRPFVKVASLQHMLPTRCTFEAEFDKSAVNKESIKEPKKKRSALMKIKKEFEDHHKSGKSKWLFTKLRF